MCQHSEDGSYQRGCPCSDCEIEEYHRTERRRQEEEYELETSFVQVSEVLPVWHLAGVE